MPVVVTPFVVCRRRRDIRESRFRNYISGGGGKALDFWRNAPVKYHSAHRFDGLLMAALVLVVDSQLVAVLTSRG